MYTLTLSFLLSAPTFAADAEPFSPASSLGLGSGTLQGEAPVLGPPGPSFAVGISAARNLVVYAYRDGTESPILGEVLSTELSGGYTFGSRLRVDAAMPLYLQVDAPWVAYNRAAAGDARLQATVPLYGEADGPLAVAIVPRIGLPTGTKEAFLGRGPSAGAMVAVGGAAERFGWITNLGYVWSSPEQIEGITLGSSVDALGGAWVNVGEGMRFGAEANASYGMASALTGTRNTVATGHLFTQVTRPTGIGLVAGIGHGLIGGVGAPEYRVYSAVTYARAEREAIRAVPMGSDADGDGLTDAADGCPAQARPADEPSWMSDGCPKRTWFAGTHLVSLDPVSFGETFELTIEDQVALDAVGDVLQANPWLVRLEVGVHVDDRGDDGVSMAFSQLRADAVVAYLVGRGVAPERLIAMGYGDVSPVDTNQTDEGRDHNRRVVFTVREQRPPTM